MADIRMHSTTETEENMRAAMGVQVVTKEEPKTEAVTETPETPEAKAADDAVTEETTEAVDDTTEEVEEKPQTEHEKTIQRMKSRIGKLAMQKNLSESALEATRVEMLQLKQQLQVLQTGKTAVEEEPKVWPTRPKPQESEVGTKYATYGDYVEDISDWKAEVKLAQAEAKRQKTDQTSQEQRQQQAMQQEMESDQREFAKRAQKFSSAHPDYQEIVEAITDFPTPLPMQIHLLKSEMGPDLVYYLAKHEQEARKIAALPAGRMLVELGRLEERLAPKVAVKPAVSKSKAPPPVTPVKGGETKSAQTPETMKYSDWVKQRSADIKGRRT